MFWPESKHHGSNFKFKSTDSHPEQMQCLACWQAGTGHAGYLLEVNPVHWHLQPQWLLDVFIKIPFKNKKVKS